MSGLPGEVETTEEEQELIHIDEGQPHCEEVTAACVYGYGHILVAGCLEKNNLY